MSRIILLLLLISLLQLISCSSIKTLEYFKVTENDIQRYNGFFIKNPKDSIYKRLEEVFGKISSSDSVSDKWEITFKTRYIDGNKLFYSIKTKDTLNKDARIGPSYFLFSAMIFNDREILLAPCYDITQLENLKMSDFNYRIPEKVNRNDSIIIYDNPKKMVLSNFRKENLKIDDKEFQNSLSFNITDQWGTRRTTGKVWLSKKFGLLKWIRTTGRIETRQLTSN